MTRIDDIDRRKHKHRDGITRYNVVQTTADSHKLTLKLSKAKHEERRGNVTTDTRVLTSSSSLHHQHHSRYYNSFIPDISIVPLQVHYYSEALPTAALILCWRQHAKALQVTVSEGLAQGPYVVAGVGFEPATLLTPGTELTTERPHPIIIVIILRIM